MSLPQRSKSPGVDLVEVGCVKCKMWVAYADPLDLDVPIRGDMFQRRPGTDHLELPSPDGTGMDLVCPFSKTGDIADLHLFIPHLPGREIEANRLELYKKVYQYQIVPKAKLEPEPEPEVEDNLCPCGCGGEVKEGNTYHTGGCSGRHRYHRRK